MLNLLISPSNYISGYDNLHKFGKEVKKLSENVLILSDENVYKLIDKAILSLDENSVKYQKEYFAGECCFSEIDRLVEIIVNKKFTAITGFGGGKIMDTVKAAGYKAGVKIITVPTIAATCAAWSSHSAIYTEQGIASEYFSIYKNADLLFMDKKIIIESPIRYTLAGIADTLAKWIETASFTSGVKEKNTALEIAIYLARKTYDEILEYSETAVEDIKNKNYSKELDIIIEHIIFTAGLVGGIGGEACRAVAAHAINNGFTVLVKYNNKNLHGETVAFGNLVQLILDNKLDEAKKIADFYKKLGIPSNLKELYYENLTEDEMDAFINKSLYKGDTMWNLPYSPNFEMIKDAIIKANEL